jgi:dTMP kinase
MLIAFEGIDGSGKGTQVSLLEQKLKSAGLRVQTFSFPRYGNNSFSQAIGSYLNGELGALGSVAPQLASLLYAGDRFCAKPELLTARSTMDVVLCDRYVESNIAHQAAKLSPPKRESFVAWLEDIEYRIYGLPPADMTVYLKMPVATAVELIAKKARRAYTERKADIHEADEKYLRNCAEVYDHLATRQPSRSATIDCAVGHQLRSRESISEDVWKLAVQALRLNIERVKMPDLWITEAFDRVMRHPASVRGMDVEATCRLLAEEVRRDWPGSYAEKLNELEAEYVNQFLNTIATTPGFADAIHLGMARFR